MAKYAPMIATSEYVKTNLGMPVDYGQGAYRRFPTSAPDRLVLIHDDIASDPSDPKSSNKGTSLVVQFNPETLSRTLEGKFGNLEPIGWYTEITQFASTKAVPFDIPLRFSAIAAVYGNNPWVLSGNTRYDKNDIRGPIEWLEGFMYGNAAGECPDRMFVSWDKCMAATCFVLSVTTNITRWFADGTPCCADVTLKLKTAQGKRFNRTPITVLSK